MHGAVAEELAKRARAAVLALVLGHVPERAEVRRVRDTGGVRDLLHARARQQHPDEALGHLVLVAVPVAVAPQRQEVHDLLPGPGEPQHLLGRPVLLGAEEKNVVLPVGAAVEAVARVPVVAQVRPDRDLRHVLQCLLVRHAPVPQVRRDDLVLLEDALVGVPQDRVVAHPVDVGLVRPEVAEEVVPILDQLHCRCPNLHEYKERTNA